MISYTVCGGGGGVKAVCVCKIYIFSYGTYTSGRTSQENHLKQTHN